MDFGGAELVLMDVIGPLLLLLAIIFLVVRVRSRGKRSSPERTEEATHELYEKEERRSEERR